MDLLKSVLEEDLSPIVICDTTHTIIYMNPAAIEQYRKYGGEILLGRNLLHCHNEQSAQRINQVLSWFRSNPAHSRIHTYYSKKENKDVYMIALRDNKKQLIGYYEKHESRTPDPTPFYDFHA